MTGLARRNPTLDFCDVLIHCLEGSRESVSKSNERGVVLDSFSEGHERREDLSFYI